MNNEHDDGLVGYADVEDTDPELIAAIDRASAYEMDIMRRAFIALGIDPDKEYDYWNHPDSVRFADYLTDSMNDDYGKKACRYSFPNGYVASIIQGPLTYGGRDGLWGVAVMADDGDGLRCKYDTPVASDVLGHLNAEEVYQTLIDIQALPERSLWVVRRTDPEVNDMLIAQRDKGD